LTYFPIRGLAEDIRLLLKHSEIEFNDNRPTFEEWDKIKAEFAPIFGQLPAWEEGTDKFYQSKAIIRHLARKYGYYGTSEKDKTYIDMVAEAVIDWRRSFPFYSSDYEAKKKEYMELLPTFKKQFNELIKGKFMNGNKISYADFMVYEVLDINEQFDPNFLKDSDKLKTFKTNFEAIDSIADYLKSGDRPASVNGSSAHWSAYVAPPPGEEKKKEEPKEEEKDEEKEKEEEEEEE